MTCADATDDLFAKLYYLLFPFSLSISTEEVVNPSSEPSAVNGANDPTQDVPQYSPVATNTQLIVLFAYFLGIVLCLWRLPQADRWHLTLCFVAATIWGSLLWLVPNLRTWPFVSSTLIFFVTGLSQPFHRRLRSRL